MTDIDLSTLAAGIDAADRWTRMADAEIARCRAIGDGLVIVPKFRIVWSTRGHTAGYCEWPCTKHPDHYLLKFNAWLAQQEGDDFRETVAHELAHAVAAVTYADRGHGREWRSVMRLYGYEGARCHSYSTLSAAAMRRRGI